MKNLKLYGALFLALFAGVTFTACDDDDDNGISGVTPSATPSPALTDVNGNKVLLTSAGNTRFEYDDNGKLTGVYTPEQDFVVDPKDFSLSFKYDDGDAIVSYKISIALNADGLISKARLDHTEDYDYYGKETRQIYLEYSYNNLRQVTSAKGSAKGEYVEDGERETMSADMSQKYTWTDGNLTKTVTSEKGSYRYGGEKDSYTFEDITTFTYGDLDNPVRQFPVCMSISTYSFGILNMVGLFGVGPAQLPVHCKSQTTETWDDDYYYDDDYSYTSEYSPSFVMNDNGTIAEEWWDRYTYIPYGYSTTRAELSEGNVKELLETLKNLPFARHRRVRHHLAR